MNFQVAYDPAAPQPLQYSVVGRITGGRIDDPRLPHPLTDIHALVRLDNQNLAVEELTGRSNQATVCVSAHGPPAGPRPGQPLVLEAKIRQLELEPRLLESLPESMREHWYKYRPDGQVDADVNLVYDGRSWNPQLSVRCLNVAFSHHKFPYRLEHGKGTLVLKDDALHVDLTAYSGNQAVHVAAELLHPFAGMVGWIEAKGDDLPLDEKLLSALPSGPGRSPARWTSTAPSAFTTASGGSRHRSLFTKACTSRPPAAGSATRSSPIPWPTSAAASP